MNLPWLAERLGQADLLVAPGAYDAASARIASEVGHEAVYVGGFAALASAHAMPDVGIAGRTDMFEIARRIVGACSLPTVVDADTGYGAGAAVARTVTDLMSVGVAAIQIEDQVNPKRCGHAAGKQVVDRAEAKARLRVALREAAGSGTCIIARTDSLATSGLQEAMSRANDFAWLGATAVFIDAPRSLADVELIARTVEGPKVFNAAPTGQGPSLSHSDLSDLGFAIVIHPVEPLLSALTAVTNYMSSLRPNLAAAKTQLSFQDAQRLVRFEEALAIGTEVLEPSN